MNPFSVNSFHRQMATFSFMVLLKCIEKKKKKTADRQIDFSANVHKLSAIYHAGLLYIYHSVECSQMLLNGVRRALLFANSRPIIDCHSDFVFYNRSFRSTLKNST